MARAKAAANLKSEDRSMRGFSNQPRRLGAGGWIILNYPSHHQRIEKQPHRRQVLPQVLPLRRPASRMLIQPCPHVIAFRLSSSS